MSSAPPPPNLALTQPLRDLAAWTAHFRVADWGGPSLLQRMATAWAAFMKPVTDVRQPWLVVVRGEGEAAVEACYATLLSGRVKPQEGHVLSV